MNENPDRLNQLVLRTMLLEGSSCDTIIKATRKFLKEQTPEEKQILVDSVRKEISTHAKALLKDDVIDSFVDEISSQLNAE
jgi:hypothetical protein